MMIEPNFGNEYNGNLVIENYPQLRCIMVKENSLKYLTSLKICNNQQLGFFVTKSGEMAMDKDYRPLYHNTVLDGVKEVVFESTDDYLFLLYIFLR